MMSKIIKIILITIFPTLLFGQTRTIHIYVAMCDNENQGIVPVPELIGNGKDYANNLYWGAGFGVKTYFKNKTDNWTFIKTLKSDNPKILDRLLFKHKTENVYLLAEAFDGKEIKSCIESFLKAANGQNPEHIKYDSLNLNFGGVANLIAYVGHNGLMDFDVDISYNSIVEKTNDIIILACYSKVYFKSEIKSAKANPILWTTHLMAPEAYTLKSAIDGWILYETGTEIEERAAQTYNKFQKCGINGARDLFTTGF